MIFSPPAGTAYDGPEVPKNKDGCCRARRVSMVVPSEAAPDGWLASMLLFGCSNDLAARYFDALRVYPAVILRK